MDEQRLNQMASDVEGLKRAVHKVCDTIAKCAPQELGDSFMQLALEHAALMAILVNKGIVTMEDLEAVKAEVGKQ